MYNVRVADLLYAGAESEEDKRKASVKFYRTTLLVTHGLDLICGLTLIFAACGWTNIGSCVIQPLFNSSGYNMKSGASICFVLALSRCIVFPLLAGLATKLGVESAHVKEKHTKFPSKDNTDNSSDSISTPGDEDELRVRLLVHEAEVANDDDVNNPFNRNYAIRRARFCKYLFLSLVFVSSCSYQIYCGIKVSSYEWQHEKTLEVLMMCLAVLWINIQAYLYRSKIEDETKEEGLYLPKVHKHPIFWQKNLYMHRCDLCKESIENKLGGAFRCRLCDYDICLKCAKRDDIADVGEDLVRSDKGVKIEDKLSSTSYLARAFDLAKPEWKLLGLSLSCLLITCLTSLSLPHIQGKVINYLISWDEENFRSLVVTYLMIMIVQGFFSGTQSFLFTLIARKLTFQVRNKLFHSVLKQDVVFFDGTTSGTLTSKLTNDVLYMMYPIRGSLATLLRNSVMLIGGVIMCYYNSYKLSLLAFVTVGPIMYLWDLYGQFSKRLNRKMLVAWGTANSQATEALNHIRDVKSFCTEERELEAYASSNELALNAGIKDAVGSGVTTMLTGYLDLGTGVLILWFGGLLVLQGSITVGELIAFQFYWNMMNEAYQGLQGLLVQFTQAAAAAEKVFSLWDNMPDIDSASGERINWQVQGALKLENVSFFYQMRPDNKVLTDVNLEIAAGSVCALVGRSGGGKSTLIRMFLRFYDPKQGNLYLDDRKYTDLNVSDLRKQFGCVAQQTTLFAKSILYNITYGLDPDSYTMDDVIEACKKAQCYDFIMTFKDKFETRCGESGTRISGGQGQRIAIARVFLRKPNVVLLDEATSALDEESQSKVQEALDILIQDAGTTVVLVAHRLSTVQFADKIAVIDKGIVLEEGNHSELMAKPDGVYHRLVTLKLEKEKSLAENSDVSGAAKNNGQGVEEMMEQVMKERERKNSADQKDGDSSKKNEEGSS